MHMFWKCFLIMTFFKLFVPLWILCVDVPACLGLLFFEKWYPISIKHIQQSLLIGLTSTEWTLKGWAAPSIGKLFWFWLWFYFLVAVVLEGLVVGLHSVNSVTLNCCCGAELEFNHDLLPSQCAVRSQFCVPQWFFSGFCPSVDCVFLIS